MAIDAQSYGNEDTPPSEFYERRLRALRQQLAKQQSRARYLGQARLAVAVVAVGVGLSLLRHPKTGWLLLALTVAFIVLSIIQEKTLRALRSCGRSIDFYQRGMSRLQNRWAGTGNAGERFLNPLHPYARDLDIFGKASLFELLCTARTRAGEEMLAQWLLTPAPIDEVRSRQAAVGELKERVAFREKLSALGGIVRFGVKPDDLSDWGERPALLNSVSMQVLTAALALLWLASLTCWAVWGIHSFALLMTILNLGYSHRIHSRLDEAAHSLGRAAKDLALLADVLTFFEQQSFTDPRLRQAQKTLRRGGIPPSTAIRNLRRIAEYIESRHNPFARILDVFLFWSAQFLFASERWKLKFGPAIRGWLSTVGELEALAALSGFAYEHPNYVFPEFVQGGPLFAAEGFAHPLLPADTAVANDLRLGQDSDLIILSGPNMAGKSTFIRSIGINVVLAQCGATVRATRLTLSTLAVGASICVLDSLNGGTSRFYAEINRIKLISDLTRGPIPVLFLLDELLSGTNSNDRLAGTEYVVRALLQDGAIGIVSTHDLALTQIPQTIEPRAINCHFEDGLEDGLLTFDYKLKPGIVQTSNALELMRSIGLGATQ